MTAATTIMAMNEFGTPKLRPVVSRSSVGKVCPNTNPAVASAV